ncbi:two-component system response regulator [Sphingomonas sp. Leaf231]|uniref:response regulator transcription factor n=1 Tax=Sphingomonas sp. Leaf231 TaxID=1736301 RepID=UPI0006F23C17|nr:response regulator transcription factor [Sphingomonas sp. Leaf231]KQN90208.1 two-component system response regulator [Sphingomonas sp. Leaf231]
MPATILVVDDDAAIRRLLRNTLLRAGYVVIEAGDGRSALREAAGQRPAAILLDLGLPDRDGLSIIPLLRAQGNGVILVVSAREAVDEKVSALDLGADDFVTKPFDTDELLARLRVALRHQALSQDMPKIVCRGDLSIDLERRIVFRGGQELHLTRKEQAILYLLAEHAGKVMTHERIMAAAWVGDEDARVEYLRIVIRNLRQKLEPPGPIGSVIANELGVGYRLKGES